MKKFNLIKNQGYFQSLRDTKSVKTTIDEHWVEAVEIEWYASTKDKDRVWDIVVPDAFKSALEWYMMNPIVLLQHKAEKPIWVVEEANIDDNWLYIKAKITENTDWVMNQIKNGVLRAFSIWYRVKDYDTDARELADWSYDFTNIIKDLELFEISVVSIPANPFALSKSIEWLLEVKELVEWEEETVEESNEQESEEIAHSEEEWAENEEKVEEVEAEEKSEEEIESKEDEEVVDEEQQHDQEIVEEQKDWEEVVEEKEEAVEQTEIEETENEEVSENAVETPADDEVVDETSNNEVVETKSFEVSSQKALDEINMKIDSMQKWFENVIAQKDEQIKSLENKVETMSKLFVESVSTIEQLSTEIKNIPVASWLSYKRPLKKGWYSDIAETLKSLS